MRDAERGRERGCRLKKRWLILAMLCIGFILIHSLIPESKSARESLWFTESILNPLLMRFGIVANKDIIRKIAHAVEFCVFAYMLSLYWNKPIRAFYAGFTLAFLDESLQVITGRGALVTDIWIDLIGVGLGVLIERTVSLIRNKRHNNTTIISNK